MSNLNVHPWEMGETTNGATIPSFSEGRFLLVRVVPPKTKTIRDGLVATFAMISYKDNDGKDVIMTDISKTTSGYSVEFPLGKRGIMATKFRGPKSWYRFLNADTNKWYQVGKNDPVTKVNNHLTEEFAVSYLSEQLPNWKELSATEKDEHIDQYFEDMYLFGLAKDLNLAVEENNELIPEVGMVTNLYRRYTSPKEGEKYGNTIVTKFAPKEGKENLPGDYKTVDPEIAIAVYTALTTREEESFDPTKFSEVDNEDLAA